MSKTFTQVFISIIVASQGISLTRGGGGVLPYISHMAIGICAAPSGRVFAPFWSAKTGIHFVHFGLESGMLFEGTTECMNVFIVSIPNE